MKRFYLAIIAALLAAPALPAAIIGTNTPAQEITYKTIATLPKAQQWAWKKYLDRSDRQRQADQDFLHREMKQMNLKKPLIPPSGGSVFSLPLNRDPAWYGASNAQFLADNVVSFQTPAGGWSKNLNFSRHPRARGEHFAPNNLNRFTTPDDFDLPRDTNWNYVGTFDNDATTTEMYFLARVAAHGSPQQARKWRKSFLRGVDYILAAQFPNGGWPQVWPLQGGYHDTITYNDGAMLHVMQLLRDISQGENEFAFVPAKTRRLAAASLERGIQCTLATQIVVDGKPTVWCQQHNALNLAPASGRNYEMPSECSSESAAIMQFFMSLPKPDPAIIASVDGAAAWFKKTAIYGMAFRSSPDGRALVSAPGAGPLWPRYTEIGADRPIFGDRDKTIHDTLSEISKERQRGYNWYNNFPKQAQDQYVKWRANIPDQP
ncbi:MAG TPA: pectate lyase [Verrucomicrobiae bacterium]|jgi:PelA/Pel-15E family pectate lyase